VDLIAERIRSLGFPAPGTYASFATLATVQEVDGVPNAKDMIDRLTLTFNRARQAAITKELMDIVNGAEALKFQA